MGAAEAIHTNDYRDSLSISGSHGGRIRIFPKQIIGPLYKWRMFVAYVLIGMLFIGPFLEFDGHPLFLFNVLERKFILFGVPFWPQDLHLFALGLLTFMVFIVLFTVVFGRIWCGWACPQTIFLEMIFRKIENWIEGDFRKQQKFEQQPWNANKILRKGLKHLIFITISFAVANTFLAYIIGKNELFKIITDNPVDHLAGLFAIGVFTLAFYFVFAKFRELVCIIVCPYGRLQGVFLDKKTVVVAYDYKRGEPRGHIKKDEIRTSGDCVDCHLCVDVCPTGIDIRNGTQLECVNCTACMDACDDVMHKVNKPLNLIRYDSIDGIEKGTRKIVNTRTIAYSVVLLILIAIEITLLSTRNNVETTVLRTPGMMFQKTAGQKITNLYNYEIVNKTFKSFPAQIRAVNLDAKIKFVGNNELNVPANDIVKGAFFIELSENAIRTYKTELELEVVSNNKVIDRLKTNFIGPVTQ
ncbi:MAG: cytochrome c oxidase accessory protein CcoG [Bacteroidota bacterium]|nr:cytochrome c oxidase accessory protein CcoG [Bacteroidota bacterium]